MAGPIYKSFMQSLGAFAAYDYQPISPSTGSRKRSIPLELLEDNGDSYSSYAEPGKRRKVSLDATEVISDDVYYSLGIKNASYENGHENWKTYLASLEPKETTIQRIVDQGTRKIDEQKESELQAAKQQAQAAVDAHSQIEQQLQDEIQKSSAAQKEITDLKSHFEAEKESLETQLTDAEKAAAELQSQHAQALENETQKTQAAQDEAIAWRTKGEDDKKKLTNQLAATEQAASKDRSQYEQELQNEKQKTKVAHEEANASRSDFDALKAGWKRIYQAAVGWCESGPSPLRRAVCSLLEGRDNALAVIGEIETSRPDQVMEDAGQLYPSSEDLAEADTERDSLRRQLNDKENENERLRDEIERSKQQRDAAVPSAQSSDAYPSPAEFTDRDDASTPLSNYGSEQTQPPAAPKRGAVNHLARARQTASHVGQIGQGTAGGIQKATRTSSHPERFAKVTKIEHQNTRPTAGSKGPSMAGPSVAKAAEHKVAMLDDHLKSGASQEVFNQVTRKKESADRYVNRFHGKGFDSYEASKIQDGFYHDFEDFNIKYDGVVNCQYWDDEDNMVYHADRGQQRPPLRIEMHAESFDIKDEAAVRILPLSKNFEKLEEKEKFQYAQACIIAQLPETQSEAARSFLSSDELHAFEQRSFNGRKPVGKCYDEIEYPKMFKKVVNHLRNSWQFKRCAKLWAAGEPAWEDVGTFSCWPQPFKEGKEYLADIMPNEEKMDAATDEQYTTVDCKASDEQLTDKAKFGLELSDVKRKKKLTLADLTKAAGYAGINDECPKRNMPDVPDLPKLPKLQSQKGLGSMFQVPQ